MRLTFTVAIEDSQGRLPDRESTAQDFRERRKQRASRARDKKTAKMCSTAVTLRAPTVGEVACTTQRASISKTPITKTTQNGPCLEKSPPSSSSLHIAEPKARLGGHQAVVSFTAKSHHQASAAFPTPRRCIRRKSPLLSPLGAPQYSDPAGEHHTKEGLWL